MNVAQLETATAARKSRFFHFRWLLFIWLGAVAALHAGTKSDLGAPVYLLFAAFLLSQGLLWALPLRHFEGLKVPNAIFLLDLNFVLLGVGISNQLHSELLMTLFLGIFMAALSKSMLQSLATTLVIISVYLSFKLRTPDGFHFNQPEQLLQLPFLFISCVHSSLLAQEASSELDARRVLSADKSRLSRQMNSSFAEIAHYCKDMSALVDALPFGAIMIDGGAKLRICNDIAEEVLGLDSGAVLGESLDGHPRLALLKPFLEKAVNEPLSDFMRVEFPEENGGSWNLNLGVYPVQEGGESRGLLLVLIPEGYDESLKAAMPKPMLLPDGAVPSLKKALGGLSLAELGLSYG